MVAGTEAAGAEASSTRSDFIENTRDARFCEFNSRFKAGKIVYAALLKA